MWSHETFTEVGCVIHSIYVYKYNVQYAQSLQCTIITMITMTAMKDKIECALCDQCDVHTSVQEMIARCLCCPEWCPPMMSTTDFHHHSDVHYYTNELNCTRDTSERLEIVIRMSFLKLSKRGAWLLSKVVKFPNAICVNKFARNSPGIHLFCQMHSPKGGRSMGAKIGQRPPTPANSVSWTPADACAQFLPPLKPKLFDTYQDGTVHS